MKIVLLIDSLHSIAAGSERQIFKLIEGLAATEHEVRLFVLRHTEFSRALVNFPCPIESLDIFSIVSIPAALKMHALRKRLLKESVDVIHAYFPDACLLAPLFLKHASNKIITSRRDMGLIYKGKPAWLYRSLRHRTDRVISNSAAVAKLITTTELLTNTQSLVIYNGIETLENTRFETNQSIYRDTNSLKLILVANIKPVKRTLDAVKAIHQLLIKDTNVELALVGEKQDPTYVLEIENYIHNNALQSSIHWLGQVNEPRRVLPQAHIGLLISDSEGLSNAIMEYMQAGLPIIATSVGGNPELVSHEENGLLIEKGNITQFVEAVLKLGESQSYRETLGATGKQRINAEFSIASMINKHVQAYQAN